MGSTIDVRGDYVFIYNLQIMVELIVSLLKSNHFDYNLFVNLIALSVDLQLANCPPCLSLSLSNIFLASTWLGSQSHILGLLILMKVGAI